MAQPTYASLVPAALEAIAVEVSLNELKLKVANTTGVAAGRTLAGQVRRLEIRRSQLGGELSNYRGKTPTLLRTHRDAMVVGSLRKFGGYRKTYHVNFGVAGSESIVSILKLFGVNHCVQCDGGGERGGGGDGNDGGGGGRGRDGGDGGGGGGGGGNRRVGGWGGGGGGGGRGAGGGQGGREGGVGNNRVRGKGRGGGASGGRGGGGHGGRGGDQGGVRDGIDLIPFVTARGKRTQHPRPGGGRGGVDGGDNRGGGGGDGEEAGQEDDEGAILGAELLMALAEGGGGATGEREE